MRAACGNIWHSTKATASRPWPAKLLVLTKCLHLASSSIYRSAFVCSRADDEITTSDWRRPYAVIAALCPASMSIERVFRAACRRCHCTAAAAAATAGLHDSPAAAPAATSATAAGRPAATPAQTLVSAQARHVSSARAASGAATYSRALQRPPPLRRHLRV